MTDNKRLFEKKVLKLNDDDTSYIFIKPDSDEYKDKVIVVVQDAHGTLDVHTWGQEGLSQILRHDQYKEVMSFISSGASWVRPKKSEQDPFY